ARAVVRCARLRRTHRPVPLRRGRVSGDDQPRVAGRHGRSLHVPPTGQQRRRGDRRRPGHVLGHGLAPQAPVGLAPDGTVWRMAAGHERPRPGLAAAAGALGVAAAIGLAVLFFYVVVFPIRGIRVPGWSDAQIYIWWARRAGTLGLSAFGTGTRPGTVALLPSLATLLHVPVEA